MRELDKFNLKNEIERPLTTDEAARFLGISAQALLNLVSNGKLPYYKFERRNRYLASELLKIVMKEARGLRDGL